MWGEGACENENRGKITAKEKLEIKRFKWSQFAGNYAFCWIIFPPDKKSYFCKNGGESKWAVAMRNLVRREQDSYGPSCPFLSQTQCILCYWQGWILIICPSWLPFEEKMQRCSLTLEGHWSQEQLISTRLHPSPSLSLPPPPPPASPLCLVEGRQRWAILCFLLKKWKFESERWSEASKGTCNWAALDRLSGNMKQQQLWRRVIASPGSYNALSSL